MTSRMAGSRWRRRRWRWRQGSACASPPAFDLTQLFGEDQGRYLLAVPKDQTLDALKIGEDAGVEVTMIGAFGGDNVTVGGGAPVPLVKLAEVHQGALGAITG